SHTMSIVALSPVGPEPPSPMVTSVTPVTPIRDPDASTAAVTDAPLSLEKPPPLHTGADWKVVLHLPEIEKWLRATSDRVTQLTHSVGQDSINRHVDVHLVQLKDICEDISDHVEQIHALLETEFSLKLLSYSVNIIVDIRTVQLLWHQLRVSVLVLKERLLQGLQDSNGNFTRQTDILQAFTEDQHQTRLDALTEVDDCGQLTIRCSQDYFSLDCGITAFELSDYSPGDEPEARVAEPDGEEPSQDLEQTQASNLEPEAEESGERLSNHKLHNSLPELTEPADSTNHNYSPSILPTMQCGVPIHSESAKRPLQGVSHSTEVSPTQPSLPKRAALFSDGGTGLDDSRGGPGKVSLVSGLQHQAELSRSTPSLMDPPDRSKFWLELDSVYPENVSQSYESLQVMNGRNLQRNHVSSRRLQGSVKRPPTDQRSSSGARLTTQAPPPLQEPPSQGEISKQMERTQRETHAHSEGDSDSSLKWNMKCSRPPLLLQGPQVSSKASPDKEHWYGSEEFLALPAQLRKTEMLAMKLESLAQSVPLVSYIEALQDVDDWELTELNTDWDLPYRRNLLSRFSPSSSSDIAPSSLDGSIESGPLSDLQSEDEEGRRSAEVRRPQLMAPLVDGRGGASLVQQLLEDVQSQDRDPDVWRKMECFVQQLDGFISWLQEALDSTENWTQPRQELDSLRVYLDTHLVRTHTHAGTHTLRSLTTVRLPAVVLQSSHAELLLMESKKTSLLGRAESLKRSATELPADFHRKIHNLTHTWRQLEVTNTHTCRDTTHNPRSALSPLTNSLLEQLEARIKELKAWLRDTELLIFNSCLRQHKDASEQLQSFKSLCSEVRARRRGVSSVLKLCQKLLQQNQAEQHWEALQLLSINLERRWEAIVMQALQWQNRLKRELGEQQVRAL
uniref:A kinase (PRKA) anchor protein 6 n=1 Tax=Sparus aurata TaxID=8175 RepID=A0A671VXA7_SPAAU